MLIIDSQKLTAGSKVILSLCAAKEILTGFSNSFKLRNAVYPEYADHIAQRRLNSLLYKLVKRGWITSEFREAKKIIRLTSKGQLEALLIKSRLKTMTRSWDGKWRLVIFDIPEQARRVRDRLRQLLREFGFKPLQASVYISPTPLNQESVEYLKKTKLIRYVRMLRVDKIDDAADILNAFKMKVSKNSRP